MKKLILLFAITVGLAFGATYDEYLSEAKSRCITSHKGSFLCDGMRVLSTLKIRGVDVEKDVYARMIMCSSFALATKFEKYDIYEGTDVALSYKSNGEIAWVLLTHMTDNGRCGTFAKDIIYDKYIK